MHTYIATYVATYASGRFRPLDHVIYSDNIEELLYYNNTDPILIVLVLNNVHIP